MQRRFGVLSACLLALVTAACGGGGDSGGNGGSSSGGPAPMAPAITTQPTDQSVTAGQTATFTVMATGTPSPSYQWTKGSTAIAGATSASYTTPATVAGDNGATFTVTVNVAPVSPATVAGVV